MKIPFRWPLACVFFFLIPFLVLFFHDIFWEKKPFLFLGEKNFSVLRTPSSDLFFWGDSSLPEVVLARDTLSPFLKKNHVVFLHELEDLKKVLTNDVTIFSLGDAVKIMKTQQTTFLFFDGEKEDVSPFNVRISLDSDFWVLKKTVFPARFPAPKKAILFLGERAPGKTLIDFAEKHHLTLVSFANTQGFSLLWNEQTKDWDLLIRENKIDEIISETHLKKSQDFFLGFFCIKNVINFYQEQSPLSAMFM